jgi:hyperosmotically inducible protein
MEMIAAYRFAARCASLESGTPTDGMEGGAADRARVASRARVVRRPPRAAKRASRGNSYTSSHACIGVSAGTRLAHRAHAERRAAMIDMQRWAPTLVALTLLAAPAVRAADDSGSHGAMQEQHDADNTGRNVRDRQGGAVTPMQQGNGEQDLAITQHIRRAVVNDDHLSTNAHNVKIVTQDGVVTLRGPVASAQERQSIVTAAWSAPGVKRVQDQLEVEQEK